MNTFLLILGGVAAVMVASNWKKCSTTYVNVDANGNVITGPCQPGQCTSVSRSVTPPIGCLLNPFPGGL